MNIKLGDSIVCINPRLGRGIVASLTKDKIYRVLEIVGTSTNLYHSGGKEHWVDIEDDENFRVPVSMKNFKLVRHYKSKLGKILYSVKNSQQ